MSSTGIEVKYTCPLGSKCEEVKDGAIHRCAWLVGIEGNHPQTGEPMKETIRCAMAWGPILSIEMSRTNRGQTKALEDFRNQVVKGNDELATAIRIASSPRPTQYLE